jgi:hypothetical protein
MRQSAHLLINTNKETNFSFPSLDMYYDLFSGLEANYLT